MDPRRPLLVSDGVLRKAVIFAVLGALLVLGQRFVPGASSIGPAGLAAIGFFVLVAYTLGQVADRANLPPATGHFFAGLVMGPHLLRALPLQWDWPRAASELFGPVVLDQLMPFRVVAGAVLAFNVGAAVRLQLLVQQRRVMGAMIAGPLLLLAMVFGFAGFLIAGGVPLLTVPGLHGLDPAASVLAGLVLGAVALSSSPLTSFAVADAAGADGTMTRTVLGVLPIKELVAAVAFAAAAGALTLWGSGAQLGAGLGMVVLVRLAGTLMLGLVLGAALAAYLRLVRSHEVFGVVALGAAALWAASWLKLEPLLVFVVGGFVAANVSEPTRALSDRLRRLAAPVFVFFFALTAARLPLASLLPMLPWAAALALARLFCLRVGAAVAARAVGADLATERYGWLGFLPHAGLAIPCAALLAANGTAGSQTLASLVLGMALISELLGASFFKAGLSLANELPSLEAPEKTTTAEPAGAEAAGADSRAIDVLAPEPAAKPGSPWGEPAELSPSELQDLTRETEADLQALVHDVQSGQIEAFRRDAAGYLRQLRMEVLRHHRRVLSQLLSVQNPKERASVLSVERTTLAERWAVPVLARAARLRVASWSPTEIVEALDAIVEQLPDVVMAPVELSAYQDRPRQGLAASVSRGVLRARRRWGLLTRGVAPSRRVEVRALLQFHLTGRLPSRLEGFAAAIIDGEQRMVHLTRSMFEAVVDGYGRLAERLPNVQEPEQLRAEMASLRRLFEEEVALATKELNSLVDDASERIEGIVGQTWQSVKGDLPRISTPDLKPRARRPARAHADRVRGLKALGETFDAARRSASAQYSLLALEFEMASLEGRIADAVEEYESDLERSIAGRAHHQLARIEETLSEVIARFDALFAQELTGIELTASLRAEAKPLERVVAEAVRAALQLRDQLTDERAATPVLDAIGRAARALTDHYLVPATPVSRGAWKLPPPVTIVEVPFREIVQSQADRIISPALLNVSRRTAAAVEPLVSSLEELDRLISFNIEVAVAEVDVFQHDVVAPDTRELVRDLVLGALQRSRARFTDIKHSSSSWAAEARLGVHEAVINNLQSLRWQIAEGKAVELRGRLRRQAVTKLRWIGAARRLPSAVTRARQEASEFVRATVGTERLTRARQLLGLPAPVLEAHADAKAFAPPDSNEHLPLVYRRLFSAHALEAGDLLVGRAQDIVRARQLLAGEGKRRLRAVVLAGPDGVGKGAVANAIVRGLPTREIVNIELTAPATEQQVASWFDRTAENRLVTVSGFHWLMSAAPGGFAPLRRFVQGVVEDAGKNAWLMRVDDLVWEFACEVAALEDAFPEIVRLNAFTVEQLQAAVLARHAMSGYGLSFASVHELRVLQRTLGSSARTQQAWFRALHEASGGLIRDALRMWLASVKRVDDSSSLVHMGKIPRSAVHVLQQLPEPILLTLLHLSRSGWTSPSVHASLFGSDEASSAAHLRHLVHMGLLEPYGPHFRIAVHLRGPVVRALTQRGWVA